jgi:hypothetical protein
MFNIALISFAIPHEEFIDKKLNYFKKGGFSSESRPFCIKEIYLLKIDFNFEIKGIGVGSTPFSRANQ